MLAAIFVSSGAKALVDPDPLVQVAKPVTDRIGPVLARLDRRAPTEARTLVRVNAAVQFVGGALLVTRLRRPAAVALAGSLVPTTLAAHSFWAEGEPAVRDQQRIQFVKNLGLLGGLMLAALDTQGRPSLRWRAGHELRRRWSPRKIDVGLGYRK
jgi:uncharacterized membrane protein YphA (DoxX/SURF4 family)